MKAPHGAAGQGGTSLVELLVGVALGLLLLSGGLGLLHSHLLENRRLIVEARLMTELRAAVDAIARDLRRAGHWANAGAAVRRPDDAEVTTPNANPYGSLWPDDGGQPVDPLSLTYSRDGVENDRVDSTEHFGFRLRGQGIDFQLGQGNWQALTDPATVRITRLSLTPHHRDIELPDACDTACTPQAARACAPRVRVREVDVAVEGRSSLDARVTRAVQTTVRLRNDALMDACAE